MELSLDKDHGNYHAEWSENKMRLVCDCGFKSHWIEIPKVYNVKFG